MHRIYLIIFTLFFNISLFSQTNKASRPSSVPATITSFYPSVVGPGDTITIIGTNLLDNDCFPFIQADGVVETLEITSTKIVCIAGNFGTPGTGYLGVYDNVFSQNIYAANDITYDPTPIITSITPLSGKQGDTINITGRRLNPGAYGLSPKVKFGDVNADSVIGISNYNIRAVVGNGNTGDVTLTNAYSLSTTFPGFVFVPQTTPPTITSFSPTTGKTGDTITIIGTEFAGATIVSFGGVLASSFKVVSKTKITAVVGNGASGSVSITTPGGTKIRNTFTYYNPLSPTITSFSPTIQKTGGSCIINGTNFAGTTAVSFGGIAASSFIVNSATKITAIIGSGASGNVSVTTANGTTTKTGFILLTARVQDSLALVDLYNNTGGPNWYNHTNWPTFYPMNLWKGITLDNNGRVSQIILTGNNLVGTIPASIGNLTELTILDLGTSGLSNNQLSGNIPDTICSLNKLRILRLGSNKLTGNIPSLIGKLTELTNLDLGVNKLTGVIPTSIGTLNKLIVLNLGANELNGALPSSIGNLINLQELFLYNNFLSGAIPISIGNLSNLTYLDLSGNLITGNIPSEIGNLNKLLYCYLGSNKLTGNIPGEIGNLVELQSIDLSSNQLTGNMPDTIVRLPKITTCIIYSNLLSGTFPTPSKGSTLISLYNNNFNFNGIETLSQLTNATYYPQLKIHLNKTANILSVSVGGTPANNTYKWYKGNTLVATNISDSTFAMLTDGVYSVIVTNSIATKLTLYSDSLIYSDPIGTLRLQDSLVLTDFYKNTNGKYHSWKDSTNWLTNAPINTWFGVTVDSSRVTKIELPNNNVWGIMPSSIGNLTKLKTLNLSQNAFSTPYNFQNAFPASIGNLTNLKVLNLGSSYFSGPIFPSIGNLINLDTLDLSNCDHGDTIPFSIGNLINLTYLDLSRCNLQGSIPISIGNLTKLTHLDLEANPLTGEIPKEIGNLSSLTLLNFGINDFTGNIPKELGNLSNLNYLYLNNLYLTGGFPSELCNLSKLKVLDLSFNNLSGSLPIQFGNLTNLTNLYLEKNQFSGILPMSIENMSKLFQVNIAYNKFSGGAPLFSNTLRRLSMEYNDFNFDGFEELVQRTWDNTAFTFGFGRAHINKTNNILSVYAGGTLSNNTYRWKKIGGNTSTIVGDSTYKPTEFGQYMVSINNSIVGAATMQSDTVNVTGVNVTLCNPVGTATLNASISSSNYQWQESTDGISFNNISENSFYSGTTTSNLQLNNIPSAWYGHKYRCVVDGANSGVYMLKFSNQWTGSINSDWTNPANWSCGFTPDLNTDVIIKSGTVVLNSNATVRSLTVNNNASFTISSGYTLTILH